jgi:hypothetical protein
MWSLVSFQLTYCSVKICIQEGSFTLVYIWRRDDTQGIQPTHKKSGHLNMGGISPESSLSDRSLWGKIIHSIIKWSAEVRRCS